MRATSPPTCRTLAGRTPPIIRVFMFPALVLILFAVTAAAYGEESGNERAFPQSKSAIEKALREMQSSASGRLPVLDGFANPAGHALDRYQRGYYQSKFQVTAEPYGGATVKVTVQVTAYYVDPAGAKSAYQVLPSNGRLEQDLLDQLADRLGGQNADRAAPGAAKKPAAKSSESASAAPPSGNEPTISAPMPRFPEVRGSYSSPLAEGLAEQEKAQGQAGAKKPDPKIAGEGAGPLQTEINSLQEVLKNQGHPKNLVAVKDSGTPVVASASLTARTLFLATAHDEFEMLDFSKDWVHVKISGLSRGWIWRNNLEMPGDVPEGDTAPGTSHTAAALFHVAREEDATFPGDWAPLRSKNVKIVSIEQVDENAKDLDPRQRLEFAKSVLNKDYSDLARKPQNLAGMVLIFDAADGGMIAATFATLQEWKAGMISDAALWHQCFFDPPETFTSAGAAASR
jgi:hypothetical protein